MQHLPRRLNAMQAGQVILHAYQTPSAMYSGYCNPVVMMAWRSEPSKLARSTFSAPWSTQYIFLFTTSTAMPVG